MSMTRFSDLLKAPLPSQREDDYTAEAAAPVDEIGTPGNHEAKVDPDINKIAKAAAAKNANVKPVKEESDDIVEEEGLGVTDDATETAPELKGIEDEIDPEDPTDAVISDDLSEDDDTVIQKIDDTIQRAATPILLGGELSGDEADDFVESVNCDAAIADGFMTERTIVKFDKKARFAQLHKVAVLAIAKEKKDPLYKKLVTAWRIEKTIEGRLTDKYGSQANARVRVYLQRAKQSKSAPIKNAANKLDK